MTFQPVVPFGGTLGWAFLQRTREAQEAAFTRSPQVARLTGTFAERIGRVTSAEELVSDRQLLRVALGAFGLDGDLDNRFFIRKVLEEGTTERGALANRLADKRYFAMAEAFGFGDRPGGNVARPGFADSIVTRYTQRQFEVAIGAGNPDMRLLLGLARDLTDLALRPLSNDGRWFTLMATPPLRSVFERALGLPQSVGTLDIDRQLGLFKERAAARLGTSDIRALAGPDGQRALVRGFLAASEIAGPAALSSRGSAALSLLSTSVAFARR